MTDKKERLAPKEPGSKKQELPDSSKDTIWGRRDFFNIAGWVTLLGGVFIGLLAFLRFMFPRVLFEPVSQFKAGFPEEYPVGQVSTRFKKSQKVWIVRTEAGFYGLLARCTHLGCTPGWFQSENKFKCFCHGSGFHKTGVNFEGPAPRPLERVKISLADDGQLLLDRSVLYKHEEWDKEDAFLKI